MEKNRQIQDLTIGKPVKVLSIYAIPMLISMLFQQAYNLIDSWIAGNYIGEVALGAVGTCYPITVFLIAISSGLSLGTSIFCSQTYGAKNFPLVKTAISTSLLMYMPLAIVIGIVGWSLSSDIVTGLSVPMSAHDATVAYLKIYLCGFPFQFLYNIVNGVLTGLGNSRTPLIYLIISCICNIFLDWFFVVGLHMSIEGLALATVISQMLSAGLTCWTVSTISKKLADASKKFSFAVMKTVIKLGVPSMIQHMLISIGQISLQSVINGYGLSVMAGYSVAFRINGLVMNSYMALSNALSGYIAQNKGAEKYDRIRTGIGTTVKIAFLFSVCVILMLQIFGVEILGFFIEDSSNKKEVIAAGMHFIRVVTPFYLLVCVKSTFDGALRGIGAMTCFMLATMSDVVVRVLCGQPFSDLWGLNGVWAVWPVAWVVGTSLSVGFYIFSARRYNKPADSANPS